MATGLVVGAIADPRPLKPLILPVTILMIYPIMATLERRSLVAHCHRRKLALVLPATLLLLPCAEVPALR